MFRVQRDAICVKASNDVAAINAEAEGIIARGGALAELAANLRQVIERGNAAQAELDALDVPESWAEFVQADNARRHERGRLLGESADALARGDLQAAQAMDGEITAKAVATEAAEDSYGLRHCP
jgi:hypothetical protein